MTLQIQWRRRWFLEQHRAIVRVLIDGRWVIVRMYLSKEITKVEATAAVKREAAAIVADVKSGKLVPK